MSTADSMVCFKKYDNFYCHHHKICNVASVLCDWLKQWLEDHGEHQNNNNGVMMNLKWEFIVLIIETHQLSDNSKI